jgi:DNA (cytosine-5)-methyltransferase 1
MIFGSVCSGIEAASVAWEPLGWKAAWFSEIEKFPSQLLSYRYPLIPNLGDMTKLYDKKIFQEEKIDLLVGGTPCQSFSIAGLRKGMLDARGNLTLEFLRVLDSKKPRWFVWENVPGVLSTSEGRDFGCFLRGIQECGYGFAYRILDARFFGVPQRRRRVYVVGHSGGDWGSAVKALFEPKGVQGNPAKDKAAKQNSSNTTDKSANEKVIGFNWQEGLNFRANEELSNPLIKNQTPAVLIDGFVRRLTVKECERLQGFPDNYTRISRIRNDDANRYIALGNSMAVPVMRWIGERIQKV